MSLLQLNIKCWFAWLDIRDKYTFDDAVWGSYATEDLVEDDGLVVLAWEIAADLGEYGEEAGLAQEGGFTAHVWACEQQEALLILHREGVGH